MPVDNFYDIGEKLTDTQASLLYSSMDMRNEFQEWLANGNARKYSAEALLSCIDRVSEYAIKKKITSSTLWKYTNNNVFSLVNKRLLEDKLLRVTDRNTHRLFIVVGQFYLRFLKDKPWVKKEKTVKTDENDANAQPHLKNYAELKMNISPEDVISWLITQPNANGTLYFEHVARQYMSALRSAPLKFEISDESITKSVFTCQTPDKLEFLWGVYKTAPNYKQVNQITSGAFSAGMACYMRYLEYLSGSSSKERLYMQSIDSHVKNKPQLDVELVIKLTAVLSAHFANGYRINSPIEMARFRSFAAEHMGEELTLSDEELKTYILASGTAHEGKIYVVSIETKERIEKIAKDYFVTGAQIIFFSEFYAKNEDWLFRENVISEDMLIGIFRGLFPRLSFTQTYFGYTNTSVFVALESEILRVWGDCVLLTYDQIAKRLPYISLDRIKYALGQNGNFIWNSVETFSHISRIEILDKERELICATAMHECNARGYVSMADLPCGVIAEHNYLLSLTAVHNAVYRICLLDKFDKKGKIITRKGDAFDALTIMKEYCRTIEKCSLEDLLSYERELTGEIHRWIPMEAGNAILVRVDKDTYVADRFINFNVDLIDEAIDLVVKKEYLPLKSFTSFGAFTDCGQPWNLFLLESYCRRFSQKFRFDTSSVNSRNAGAVISKSCNMDYIEIMTDAVAKADVLLQEKAVGRFLFENGYTGRSTNSNIPQIIEKAKAIRGGLNDARN